ncbi:type II secretion system F family protein [Antarctobacter sp.]|uniref:type II secretion system F family protein n=1 Tax=Antarctobacter sp. TaxID=1872577 RepID=UPI003A92AE22
MLGDGVTTMLTMAVLGCALLLAVALRMIFSPEARQERAAADRMKDGKTREHQHAVEAVILKQRQSSVGRDWPVVGNLRLLVRHADMEGCERGIVLGFAASAVFAAMTSMFFLKWYLAIPLGALTGVFGTISYLKIQHAKRVTALTNQLPDALDLMMRGLRVGHPVSATIANVGRTMPDPVGREFRILAEQISFGDYLTDAFADMADRVGHEDVEYLSVSIRIQHRTGGNLADVLGTLSKVVRERIILRRRIQAISSEGRLSAYLLSALPVAIFLSTSISSPGYYSDVSDAPAFIPIAVTIVLLVVGNALALRKLVNFAI